MGNFVQFAFKKLLAGGTQTEPVELEEGTVPVAKVKKVTTKKAK